VGETTRKYHAVSSRKVRVTVPNELGVQPDQVESVLDISFAVRAWEHDYSRGHDVISIV
jgi:hypothetical protein